MPLPLNPPMAVRVQAEAFSDRLVVDFLLFVRQPVRKMMRAALQTMFTRSRDVSPPAVVTRRSLTGHILMYIPVLNEDDGEEHQTTN